MDNQQQQAMSAGFVRSHYRNGGLYLPEMLLESLEQETLEASEEAADLVEERCEDLVPAPTEVCVPEPTEADLAPAAPTIPVFDMAAVRVALASLKHENDDRSRRGIPILEAMAVNEGQRRLIEQPQLEIVSGLARLAVEMPNFAPIITLLTGELALARASRPEDFRVTCICMDGVPGIGKTRFAREVGKILGVGFEQFSMGSAQGCFELIGTSANWSNSRPGRLIGFMAESMTACPVILLDEIDKIDGNERYSIVPALLDLLERDTAKAFRDDCLELRFDASKIIFLATSNDRALIPLPLLSRMRVVEVLIPTQEQRREIIDRMAGDFAMYGVSFLAEVLDDVCELDMDLRHMSLLLREMAGKALTQGERVVTMPPENLAKVVSRMGFI